MKSIHSLIRTIVVIGFNALLIYIDLSSPIIEPSYDGEFNQGIRSAQIYTCFYLIIYDLFVLINLFRRKTNKKTVIYGMILLFLIAYPILEIPLRRTFLDDSIVYNFWKYENLVLFSQIFSIVIIVIVRGWKFIFRTIT